MSVIRRFNGTQSAWDWENVLEYPMAPDDDREKGTSGKIVICPQDGASHFVFRYFRVEPGGHSTFKDHHAHDHGVIILHGRALVHLGENQYEAGPNDVVYISPWDEHWFEPVGNEPLGFLCVIANKERLK